MTQVQSLSEEKFSLEKITFLYKELLGLYLLIGVIVFTNVRFISWYPTKNNKILVFFL